MRRIYTPVRLDPELVDVVRSIANEDHDGNLSEALRELIRTHPAVANPDVTKSKAASPQAATKP